LLLMSLSKSLKGNDGRSDSGYPQVPISPFFVVFRPFSRALAPLKSIFRGSFGIIEKTTKFNVLLIFQNPVFDPLFARFRLFSASIAVSEPLTPFVNIFPPF